MKLASARLRYDDRDSDVPVENITPAEAVVLAAEHMGNVQDYPLDDIRETGEVERSPVQERKRLVAKYGRWVNKKEVKISALFPGVMPQFPSTFEEARAAVTEQEVADVATGPEAEYEAIAKDAETRKGRPQTDD